MIDDNADLKPNGRNDFLWTPPGVYLIAKTVVLRLRDKLVNECGATDDVAEALNKALDAIDDVETSWGNRGCRF